MTDVPYPRFDCTDPGQPHVRRNSWMGMHNETMWCVRCGQQLWDSKNGLYRLELIHGIEEEPW